MGQFIYRFVTFRYSLPRLVDMLCHPSCSNFRVVYLLVSVGLYNTFWIWVLINIVTMHGLSPWNNTQVSHAVIKKVVYKFLLLSLLYFFILDYTKPNATGRSFVRYFVCWRPSYITVKMVTSIFIKLSEQTSNCPRFMPSNSPGGSTLQLGTGRGLLCLTKATLSTLSIKYIKMLVPYR